MSLFFAAQDWVSSLQSFNDYLRTWDSFPASYVMFWCLAFFVLACAIMVVSTKRVFHAGIALVGCFLGVAGFYALLNCPFMAGLQLLVYVGAIATLLMFAVMLTHNMMSPDKGTVRFQPLLGSIASVGTLALLWMTIPNSTFGSDLLAQSSSSQLGASAVNINMSDVSVASIGMRLMTPYGFAFELIAVIILATLIGAIAIARKEDRPAVASAQESQPASKDAGAQPATKDTDAQPAAAKD